MTRQTGRATTWWGKRWTGALEELSAVWRNRLPRGRTYAREGRVVGLTVEPGQVSAYVVGSRPSPYQVEIGLPPLSDGDWQRVVAQLVRRAAYTARLLAGEMPDDIEDAFAESHVALFPTEPRELRLECTCPDRALPCKHIAATHYVLGEAFDHDPFLLFALRGRDRDALLGELRAARAAATAGRSQGGRSDRRGATPGDAAGDAPIDPKLFASARGDLQSLSFRIEPPPVRGAVLKSLGKPPGWRGRVSLAERLEEAYDAASVLAQAIALGEEQPPPAESEGP